MMVTRPLQLRLKADTAAAEAIAQSITKIPAAQVVFLDGEVLDIQVRYPINHLGALFMHLAKLVEDDKLCGRLEVTFVLAKEERKAQ